jgi:GPH family glycoside/pentoside/hexuronide:cation symporter
MNPTSPRTASLGRIFGYALGEGAVSITMNGIANFAMLYYTQVLGLGAGYAGLALSITLLWDALTDPVMGHLTDNTRTRFGGRLPYMLVGGAALAVSFYLLWSVPPQFHTPVAVFWCILVVNLVVRTAVTIFLVPYTALGFEICPEYADRSRLQGVRYGFNMFVNLIFGAFAWTLFFKDRTAPDGARIDGTTILGNYLTMAAVLSAATLALVLLCAVFTWRYARDNRGQHLPGNSLAAFRADMTSILTNRLAWTVFGFFACAQLGMLMTSQIQMFTYVLYMEFNETQKTAVHGAGMIAFALGSLSLVRLSRYYDKKPCGYAAGLVCVAGGLGLLLVFGTGWLDRGAVLNVGGLTIPLAVIVFGFLQSLWWGGCGMLVPLATSMIADLADLDYRRTGVLKDGSYAAVFSFVVKAAAAGGMFITGRLVDWSGFVAGADKQTAGALDNIAIMTFVCGPLTVLAALFVLRHYPVDRAYMKSHGGGVAG